MSSGAGLAACAAVAAAASRVAMVTGANGVFGRHICAGLCNKGFEVVAIVRTASKGEALIASLPASCSASFLVADLSGGASAAESVATRYGTDKPLHVLVNNAAVTPTTRSVSAEGVEMQWATNVLAYHALTRALLPHLRLAASLSCDSGDRSAFMPRVIFVASLYAGGLDLSDVEFQRRSYDVDSAYRASKQANRMLARAWQRRVQAHGIKIVSCHPGIATSAVSLGLGFDLDRSEHAAKDGARTPLYLATVAQRQLADGAFYHSEREARCEFAQDDGACENLFKLCDEHTL